MGRIRRWLRGTLRADRFEADEVDAGSVNTEELDNAKFASAHSGSDGGEQIQNAINAAKTEPGHNVVVVGPNGPDTVTEETGTTLSDVWGLSAPIELPSDTTLLLMDCYIILKAGADTNIIRNANLDDSKGSNTSDAWANENIRIQGLGQPTLDGNGANQTQLNDSRWLNLGLRFVRCQELTVDNIRIRTTQAWGLKVENFRNTRISNIQFRQRSATANRDGVDLIGKADGKPAALVENIYGQTGDDIVAVNATQGPSETSPIENDNHGPMRNISINTVTGASGSSGVKLFVGASAGDRDIENVSISDITVRGTNSPAVHLGPTQSLSQFSPDIESLQNINITNVTARNGNHAVRMETPGRNINISNVSNTAFDSGVAVVRIDKDGHVNRNESITLENINGMDQISDTVKVASGQTIDGLTIDGVSANHDSDTGDVLDIAGTVNRLSVSGIDVESANTVFNFTGAVSGTIEDTEIDESSVTNIYSATSNVKFDGAQMPAFDAAPANIEGSVVKASSSWDPDGDGNGELVIADGVSWMELADMPNI